jgi:hypothetical protein
MRNHNVGSSAATAASGENAQAAQLLSEAERADKAQHQKIEVTTVSPNS